MEKKIIGKTDEPIDDIVQKFAPSLFIRKERLIKLFTKMRENNYAVIEKLRKDPTSVVFAERLFGKNVLLLQIISMLKDETFLQDIESIFMGEDDDK